MQKKVENFTLDQDQDLTKRTQITGDDAEN